MKFKFMYFIFIILLTVTGCDNFPKTEKKEQTDHEKFIELYYDILDDYEKVNSYNISEDSYFNFTVDGEQIKSSLVSENETIRNPFYSKGKTTMYISSVGTFYEDILLLQEEDKYNFFYKSITASYTESYTKEEFDEDFGSVNNLSFGNIPDSIEIAEERTIKEEIIITFSGDIKPKDLEDDEKQLLDVLLEFYIAEGIKSSDYNDIEITKQFI